MVLGVNGAGKSTLLKCINRILKPCGGTVLIDNEETSQLSRREIAKRVGYVAQRQEPVLQQFLMQYCWAGSHIYSGRLPKMTWILRTKP